MPMTRRVAPAAERNRGPILEALRPRLPPVGRLLEIASGTGTHAAFFAEALPSLEIQPTDPEPEALLSIEGWRADTGLDNLLAPLRLDARAWPWPVRQADAIFCANMVHIAPFKAAEGLWAGAGRVLEPGGRLFTYGPYLVDGAPTSPSNAAFDASLRGRHPAWGIRDLADLDALGQASGLRRIETLPMPANNFLLVWERDHPAQP